MLVTCFVSVATIYADEGNPTLRQKASSGVLHKWITYTVRPMTEQEIAEGNRLSDSYREGILPNQMAYTIWAMGEKSKGAFDKDGTNLATGANGKRVWYGEQEVPILNQGKTNGKQIGGEFTIPDEGVDGCVLIEVGKLPEKMQSVNINVAYKNNTGEQWIYNVPAYSIVNVFPSKGRNDVVTVMVSTSEKSSQMATFSIYTTYNNK